MPKGGVLPDDRSKISVWIQSNCKIYAFSSVIIYVVVSQMSTKRNIFSEIYSIIRCQENMAWKFP